MVKVKGSRFIKDELRYTIKMEGAAKVAYRTLIIGGVRDPILVANIDTVLQEVSEQVALYFSDVPPDSYRIISHIYGKNGVMGVLEPEKSNVHELGLVIEVVANTQDMANTICSSVRSTFMHYPYEGRKATAGNLALLYSPSDIEFGPVYKFTIYHLVEVDDPCELFHIKYFHIGKER